MFRANKYERSGQTKTSVLAKGLVSAFVALSLVSTVGAVGKGKGNAEGSYPDIGYVINEQNDCAVTITSNKGISNIVIKGPDGATIKKWDDLTGDEFTITDIAYLASLELGTLHVKSGNNGKRGLGEPVAEGFTSELTSCLTESKVTLIKKVEGEGADPARAFNMFSANNSTDPVVFEFFDLSANDTNGRTFSDLATGTAWVLEEYNIPLGYALTDVNCVSDIDNSILEYRERLEDGGGRTIQFTLRAGEHVTCTFTNTYTEPEPAKVTLIKKVEGDGADPARAFDMVAYNNSLDPVEVNFLELSANQINGRTFSDLAAGTAWVFEEFATADYALTDKRCVSDIEDSVLDFNQIIEGVTLTLRAGEHVTCTFTNTYTVP